ncbi:tetratricopeptide repeat protein [Streptomyces prunicolor]|uniref:tetratricopeptide repeat protein n=1 Tax=Streptomyces prunicolor TaxID=67348 RepID=UPI00036C59D6|nr:tetratricopeptide repeat protein [Streptomyces prunicolor]
MADISSHLRATAHGGDAYRGDITQHRLATAVHDAWHGDSLEGRTALADCPPPGAIALRSRYRHVIDSVSTGAVLAPVSLEDWNRALIAETEIDNAVHTGDYAHAALLCGELAGDSGDEVTLTNALIGSGDVHRALGQAEEAVDHYETALGHSDSCAYRFGRLRALVGLGHLTLTHHSAVRATELFEEALTLAEQIGDPLYAANAVSGLGESAERRRELNQAAETHERAYTRYVEVASVTGQAHAAQRVGVLHHRAGRLQAAGTWLVVAARAFERFDDPVGTVNVLESMGDLLLDVDDTDEAEARYREAHALAVAHRLGPATAHAEQNLGRVAQARGDWVEAVARFEQAERAYRAQGDLLGVCNALTRLADSRERMPDRDGQAAALRDRLSAVFAIEEHRAAHSRADAQQEYRERFGKVYASALRAAVQAGSPESFVVVADGLAGRRLAGLATQDVPSTVADRLTLLQHLLVSSDQRWLAQRRPPGSGGLRFPAGMARQERLNLLLGSTAIGGTFREPAREAVEDLLAAVYLPPVNEGAALLASLPAACHTLQLVVDPQDPLLLYRMWRDDRGEVLLDSTALESAVTAAETAGDVQLIASVLEFQGRYLDKYDPASAVAVYERSLALNEQAGQTRGAAIAAFFLGCALDARGDHVEALTALHRAHDALLADAEPDVRMAARALAAIGAVHDRLGDTAAADRELREAVAVLRARDALHYAADPLVRLADIARRTGADKNVVRGFLTEALAIYDGEGNPAADELRRRIAELEADD